MCEKEEKSIKVDDLFVLVFNSNWASIFVKLKLKPPLKNPGSATVPAPDLRMENYRLI